MIRRFLLLGAGQLAFVRSTVQDCAVAWARDWLREPGTPVTEIALAVPESLRAGRWQSVSHDGAACHVQHDENASQRLVFGAQALAEPSALGPRVASEALADLARRLVPGAAQAVAGGDAPAACEGQRGSGAVTCRFAWESGAITLVLGGGAVAAWLARRDRAPGAARLAPLQPLKPAIGAARVSMSATLGQAEIDVATLQSLAVGDVVTLDLRIDQPLRVSVDGRPVPHRAYLGSRNGMRALQLSAGRAEP